MKSVKTEDLLKKIEDPFKFNEVVHGTYYEVIEPIMKTGLNRMARNHVHMAVGMPGKTGVISGMRSSCQVVVEVNMTQAMFAGNVPFHISENSVILSEGLNGVVPSKYFRSVWDF